MDELRHTPEPARKSYPRLAGACGDHSNVEWCVEGRFALDEIDRLRRLVELMDRCLARAIGEAT